MKNSTKSQLYNWDLHHKRVLLRADLNLPIQAGAIINDYRFHALLPTIDYIQNAGGKVILITHLDRPQKPTPSKSTRLLIPLFEKHGYQITFAANIDDAYAQSLHDLNTIVLFENVRFFPGEKNADKTFAKQLARLGDFYVNDAFATLHRHDTSITLLAQQFPPDKRTIGLLIEKELTMLNKLLTSPKKPFVLILGGGKVSDKIPLLKHLIDKVQDVILCPAIVFTFLAAQNKKTGKSLVDTQSIELCKKLLDQAKKNNINIHFPIDYQVALSEIEGELIFVDAQSIPSNAIGISIGPKTIEHFIKVIQNAQTLFFNAAMGFEFRKETLQGTFALLQAIGQAKGFRVIGGGNSVAAAQMIHVDQDVDFISTGGGATLAYLSGEQLPGLIALK